MTMPSKPNVSVNQNTSNVRKQYVQVGLMGISAFVMNTTEFVPVALLSDIAQDFSITTANAGWMITLYAWVVALMSLPLMLMTRNIERKRLLIAIFAVFIVSHVLSVMAWRYDVFIVSRIGIAFAHALFWSITAAIAIRVAPEGKKALALSVLATGTAMAMVLGVPLGRMIGQWLGWRSTFAAIGIVAALVVILQAKLLPPLPSQFKGDIRKLPELLKKPLLLCLYGMLFLVFTAHFTAYSYIEPFMKQIGGISEGVTTLLLLMYGGAGIIGSIVFSIWGERHTIALMAGSTLLLLLSLMGLLFAVSSLWTLSMVLLIWGAVVMLLVVTIQARVLVIDSHAQDMLMSMFSGIINVGIGAGALLGGYTVTALTLSNIGYVGAAVSAMAIVLMYIMSQKFIGLRTKL